jgi:nitroreductase
VSVTEVAYTVANDLVVRRSLSDARTVQLCWGEGAGREEYATCVPELAAWLLDCQPGPLPAFEQGVAAALGVDADQAAEVVAGFRRRGLLVSTDQAPCEDEEEWRACNLSDALGFHRATRQACWQPDALHHDIGRFRPASEAAGGEVPGGTRLCLPAPTATLQRREFVRNLHWRRTTRSFAGTHITLEQLSNVLWWAVRPVLAAVDGPPPPLNVYVLFDRNLAPPGLDPDALIYSYGARDHALLRVDTGQRQFHLSELIAEQSFVDDAPALLGIAVNWDRYLALRASCMYRYAHYDVGALAQRLLLAATALDLRTFVTAAVDDGRFEALMGTDDSRCAPVHVVAIGAGSWLPSDDSAARF